MKYKIKNPVKISGVLGVWERENIRGIKYAVATTAYKNGRESYTTVATETFHKSHPGGWGCGTSCHNTGIFSPSGGSTFVGTDYAVLTCGEFPQIMYIKRGK